MVTKKTKTSEKNWNLFSAYFHSCCLIKSELSNSEEANKRFEKSVCGHFNIFDFRLYFFLALDFHESTFLDAAPTIPTFLDNFIVKSVNPLTTNVPII